MTDKTKRSPFKDWVELRRARFVAFAQKRLPESADPLCKAMRSAVLDGGKRVRPLLIYAAGEMADAQASNLDLVALAVECVHCYSLAHDDMPCMDNDVMRHGKPSLHVQYGQALAMLAADALQPEAFLLLSDTALEAERQMRLVRLLASASSQEGMCGGQAIDLLNCGRPMSESALRDMHAKKTGALLEASVMMGHGCAKDPAALDGSVTEPLARYGKAIGLAFQIQDDILDVVSDAATLGKTAGKDAKDGKPTYVSIFGLQEARRMAAEQVLFAHAALDALPKPYQDRSDRLHEIADFIVGRNR